LGTVLSEWTPGISIFNPFGEVGSMLGPVNFQNIMYRFRDAGHEAKFSNYSLAALCAQAGRFAKVPASYRGVLSFLEHGLQIGVAAYTEMLRTDAMARGVTEIEQPFARPMFNESGSIGAVLTVQGERIDGDLFIDCSGPARKLALHAHTTRLTSWSQWLPCNRVTNAMLQTSETPQPFVHLVAKPDGWVRNVSLPGRRSESFCFHDYHNAGANAESHAFTAGYYPSPWQGNCVALGGAAVTIDPSSSLSLHLLCSGILRLLDQESIEFNRQFSAEIECARDYSIAHFKLNGRVGEPFWDACRSMSVPDSLVHRIEVYENCGRVVLHDGEVVDRMNWVALFDAQGIYPKQYDVVARGLPLQLINDHLAAIRQTLLAAVVTLPPYSMYLNQLH
jgi:tryptophan halogenase